MSFADVPPTEHQGSGEDPSPQLPPPEVEVPAPGDRETRVESASAILTDTARWRHTGDILRWAKRKVECLDLGVTQFSYLAEVQDVTAEYARAQEKYAALLGEGAEVMADVQERLVAVANAIDLNESEAREAIANANKMITE